jgi:hypothetical protein
MILIVVTALFDIISGGSDSSITGTCLIVHIAYFSIISGLSASYVESAVGLFLITLVAMSKLIILGLSPSDSPAPLSKCFIYGLPVLIAAIASWGLVFPNDELKRLR